MEALFLWPSPCGKLSVGSRHQRPQIYRQICYLITVERQFLNDNTTITTWQHWPHHHHHMTPAPPPPTKPSSPFTNLTNITPLCHYHHLPSHHHHSAFFHHHHSPPPTSPQHHDINWCKRSHNKTCLTIRIYRNTVRWTLISPLYSSTPLQHHCISWYRYHHEQHPPEIPHINKLKYEPQKRLLPPPQTLTPLPNSGDPKRMRNNGEKTTDRKEESEKY